jgi:hypothetical protein
VPPQIARPDLLDCIHIMRCRIDRPRLVGDRPSRRIIPRSTQPTQRLSIETIKLAPGE